MSTVSRVLNGRPVADGDLVDQVRSAARELAYRPNTVARGLRSGRTGTIGVVVPDLANPFFPHVLKGLATAARSGDHQLLVVDSNEDPDDELRLVEQLAGRCDGIVLCSPRMPDSSLERATGLGVPTVCTNRTSEAIALATVGIDSGAGAAEGVEHLHALGHRTIGYLSGPEHSWSNDLRSAAIAAAIRKRRMRLVTVPAGSTSDDGYEALPALLDKSVTAVIAFNDLVAVGALSRLEQLKVSVPDEISVVGCDDIPTARFLRPPLTTVQLPQEELGERAWALLQRIGEGDPPAEEWIDSTLVVRESTAERRADRR